ncbi:hypothetical protein K2Y11_04030 [bacterium]|nr:hypothetical protein [bacterium]
MGLGSSVVTGYIRWPSHPGQRSLATWLSRKLLPERGTLIRLKDGSCLWLTPTTAHDFAAIRHLDMAPKLAAFLATNIRPGQLTIAAGVGNGLSLIRLSKLVGADGKVIGIEPNPRSILRARENILANELPDNVSLIAGQLGAQAGILAGSPSPNGKDKAAHRAQIQVLTESLPELLYRLGLRRADLLLIDGTAHLQEILQGITPASRPRMILVNGGKSSDAELLINRLKELGYRVNDPAGQTISKNTFAASDYLIATDREDVTWLTT